VHAIKRGNDFERQVQVDGMHVSQVNTYTRNEKRKKKKKKKQKKKKARSVRKKNEKILELVLFYSNTVEMCVVCACICVRLFGVCCFLLA